VHTNHARRSSKVRLSPELKEHACDLGERMLPSDLVHSVYTKFKVEITADQIKWILKKNSIKNFERSRHSSRAGGAVDSIRYLLMKGGHDVVLLLIRCDTGEWFTGIPSLNTATPGSNFDVSLTAYDADSQPRTRRRSSSSDSKVSDAIPDSDAESDEDTVHGSTKFDPFDYIARCTRRPLGKVKFKWAKVRMVTVAPQYDDAQKYTGQYAVICSCGFPERIGVVCRHILAVLVSMLFSIKQKFGDGDYQLDDYNSEEELDVDHADVDWDKVTLIDLCNQDIVSKIKYHAALHNKGHLFKLSDKLFRSTIPEDVAAVRQHPTKKR
jgi:hypothetical protein